MNPQETSVESMLEQSHHLLAGVRSSLRQAEQHVVACHKRLQTLDQKAGDVPQMFSQGGMPEEVMSMIESIITNKIREQQDMLTQRINKQRENMGLSIRRKPSGARGHYRRVLSV
ncbi:MAG: hypothetical protein GDA50_05250 [Alphaproteobacteria bacterium GM202ARS2]|nr:hypothetical protein [Alphaproteobacteria bacterium GM202ARS2]